MSIVSSIGQVKTVSEVLGGGQQEKTQQREDISFQDMLTNAIKEADEAYVTASNDTQALLSGEVDNLAQVMINGTKSELSLNLVIQVRNKVVDAYNEIMRMSV